MAAAQVKTANLPLNLAEMAILQVCARMIEESRASGAARRELEKQEGHCRTVLKSAIVKPKAVFPALKSVLAHFRNRRAQADGIRFRLRYENGNIEQGCEVHIAFERTFESGGLPTTWTVWPVARNAGWLDKITRRVGQTM